MKTLILLIILYTFIQTKKSELQFYQQYLDWKQNYAIKYHNLAEDAYRYLIFRKNSIEIDRHNSDKTQTYKKGLNQFSALTLNQFSEIYVGKLIPKKSNLIQQVQEESNIITADIDWVAQGAVNPVRDQGQCGASYAYAAVGAVEGLAKIKQGQLPKLSWQQILDCSSSYGNYGCNGGYMTNVFDFIIAKGITTQAAYPYIGSYQTCKIQTGSYKIKSYTQVPKGACTTMSNLLTQGPVAIAIDSISLVNYHSGIVSNCTNSPSSGALLVGQNATAWKVQMNFGVKWGVEGYIYLAPGNTCSICDVSSIPNL